MGGRNMLLICAVGGAMLLSMAALAAPEFRPAAELPAQADMPDPMVKLDGTRVRDKGEWNRERHKELRSLFQHYMYGHTPPAPRVDATVDREDREALGGKATLREVSLRFGPADARPLHLMVVTPNQRRGPAPVFLGIAFCGNSSILADPKIALNDGWMFPGPGVVNNRATEAGRGSQVDTWNVKGSVDRGYAVATFYYGDVEPDRPNAAEGIRARYEAAEPGKYDWGAVAAWAWGMSRAVDYLRTDRALDSKRIAVVGHSRNGKAAILAAALDERIAMAIPLQAGCGGTAPSRGKVGESVKAINDHFPHWFNARFKQFNEIPERLPFDQHELIALVAPRPVLLSCAVEDTWANPEGQFEMARAADPVYRLLGVEGMRVKTMPPVGELANSRLGYFIRPGKHSMTRVDWEAFWRFADRHLKNEKSDAAPVRND